MGNKEMEAWLKGECMALQDHLERGLISREQYHRYIAESYRQAGKEPPPFLLTLR